MKNGKFAARRASGSKKVFAVILATLLLIGCSVGATLAWLTATTNKVENTFTVGKVVIDLKEHQYVEASNSLNTTPVTGNSYKLIPGKDMPKDPFVTVKANSEPCWVFVRVDETNNSLVLGNESASCVLYRVSDGWTPLRFDATYTLASGVQYYCRQVNASTADQNLNVLARQGACTDSTHVNGCVAVHSSVTASVTTTPTLKFAAAAIQIEGFEIGTSVPGQEAAAFYAAALNAFEKLPAAFTSGVTQNTTTP